ncbi:phosphoribosylanthranilate isomerase [Arcicella aurantiaca]|uniref:N-(5'-phosphoribosyl)anthranilate isomerase n=1 Tax=Arcicella aurantiaca TaxID=591202 RepID=A0A316EA83_9BACT|nr:phosphoribosylanthranilate isomerase [Arcicella aurantiaca]PWK26482.1 phosphoribosylanthranilate isomerase [Arcicella aurantiaca]
MKTKVKICCISSEKEAKIALEFGADVLGLVAKMPSGPGTIDDDLIQKIVQSIPSQTNTFLLTPKTNPFDIIEHQRLTGTNCIQLVDAVKIEDYQILREKLPNIKLIQVIHVIDKNSVEEAKQYAEVADMILLDSGNPKLAIKELGGTGRVHNWELSREIVKSINKPVFLAGGLKPENIQEAIQCVKPYGLDICSGVRTNGKLDKEKLKRFFEEVNKANS